MPGRSAALSRFTFRNPPLQTLDRAATVPSAERARHAIQGIDCGRQQARPHGDGKRLSPHPAGLGADRGDQRRRGARRDLEPARSTSRWSISTCREPTAWSWWRAFGKRHPKMPMAVVSANLQDEIIARARELNAAFVAKPLTDEALGAFLSGAALRLRKAAQ